MFRIECWIVIFGSNYQRAESFILLSNKGRAVHELSSSKQNSSSSGDIHGVICSVVLCSVTSHLVIIMHRIMNLNVDSQVVMATH